MKDQARKWKEIDELLKPEPTLLVRLGSLIVHYQEAYSPKGHALDRQAIHMLEDDPGVKKWLEAMTRYGFLPVKR